MSGVIGTPDRASKTLANRQGSVFETGYGYYPQEGSRAVSLTYQWDTIAAYAEDASELVAMGVQSTIQTAYIDNSANTQGVQLIVAGTGQVINCPASSQGYFALFLTGMPSFQFATVLAGVPTPIAASTRLMLLNMPISPAVWHI